jgi:F-type H+-transporting ATPase subunit a
MGDLLNTLPLAAVEGEGHPVTIWGLLIYLTAVFAVIAWFVAGARKGLSKRTFTTSQANWAEQLYLFIENMCVSAIGAHGRKYVPMITTFWLIIFVGNLFSLFAPYAPTADLGFNLGMALVSIGYVQWEGIKTNGLFGHLSHFAGPKLGLAFIPLSALLFCIELVSEIMKNISLSLRIFANIHGGHEAVLNMNKVGENVYIPIGAFLLPLKVLTCLIQAMIFCLLTCVYIGLVTSHHDDDHGHDHGDLAHA